METGVVVGIDVAKLSLEVEAGDELHFTVANHEEGIAQLGRSRRARANRSARDGVRS